MRKKKFRFILSCMLSVVIFFSYIGVLATANTVPANTIVCEEEHEHDDNCSYLEKKAESIEKDIQDKEQSNKEESNLEDKEENLDNKNENIEDKEVIEDEIKEEEKIEDKETEEDYGKNEEESENESKDKENSNKDENLEESKNNPETKPEEKEEVIGTGNFSLEILEDDNLDVSYSAKVDFITEKEDSAGNLLKESLDRKEKLYNFAYEILDKEENVKDSNNILFESVNDEKAEVSHTFTGLKNGDKIIVKDIPSIDIQNEDKEVKVKIEVVPDTALEEYEIAYEPHDTVRVVKNEISKIEVNYKPETYKTITKDTFETVVGKYNLQNILTNYNIFSFGEVRASHIVGPIITRNQAHKEKTEGGVLPVSDLAKGIPSYIGIIDRLEDKAEQDKVEQDKADPNVKLNYGFEPVEPFAKKPKLYIKQTGNKVVKRGNQWEPIDYMKDTKGEYVAPNNGGRTPTLQNDDFMDFDKALKEIKAESQELLKNTNNIETKVNREGDLEIEVGKSYVIKDASNLKRVKFVYPKDYNQNKISFDTTIINIEGNSIGKKIIDEKVQNSFPDIYINDFKNGFNGNGGQFGENNSIVWNMPNIETKNDVGKLIRRTGQTDMLGHIVAPNAEFWNYNYTAKQWYGGNINGCAIVKSWHGGNMESHMWPYGDGDVKPKPSKVSVELEGEKILQNGILADGEFQFQLSYIKGNPSEGYIGEKLYTVSNEKGEIKFPKLTFIKEGTYYFKIKEVIPKDSIETEYDKTEYEVKIKIAKKGDKLVVDDVDIDKDERCDGDNDDKIVFENKRKKIKFTIKKIDEGTGSALQGAIFDLFEADEKGNPVGNAIKSKLTTNEKGEIFVQDEKLKYNKLYVLVETKAPDGYIEGENIVFYIKGDGNIEIKPENTTEIENGGTVIVKNTKGDEVLPETGGNGINNYILIAMVMIMVSGIFLKLINRTEIKNNQK